MAMARSDYTHGLKHVAFVDADGKIKPIKELLNVDVVAIGGNDSNIPLMNPIEISMDITLSNSAKCFFINLHRQIKEIDKSRHYAKNAKSLRIRRKHTKRLIATNNAI